MKRNELFDKLWIDLKNHPNEFLVLHVWCERYYNVTDYKLVDSIVDELHSRKIVDSKTSDKSSVMLNYDGIQLSEKYKSYSSLSRFENRLRISGRWSKRLSTAKTIIAISTSLGMFILAYNKFYIDDTTIKTQREKIESLTSKIDSLEKEIKNGTQQHLRKHGAESGILESDSL